MNRTSDGVRGVTLQIELLGILLAERASGRTCVGGWLCGFGVGYGLGVGWLWNLELDIDSDLGLGGDLASDESFELDLLLELGVEAGYDSYLQAMPRCQLGTCYLIVAELK